MAENEVISEEKADKGESFQSFRERMIQKAIIDDFGIVCYRVDGDEYSPETKEDLKKAKEIVCVYRRK
jgi:hypothetical protein